MAATLELKYFNSFWIKKLDKIVDVIDSRAGFVSISGLEITVAGETGTPAVGQLVRTVDISNPIQNKVYVIAVSGSVITVSAVPQTQTALVPGDKLIFGPLQDFTFIPGSYTSTQASDWYIEESRIRGGYNNTDVDLGVKAYIVEDDTTQNHRFNSMIYSGIFNSRTGVNNTNEFSVGEEITRSLDPVNGSIQKLYSEDTNLIIFQESKISNALIDKDAIYSAEGQPLTTSGNLVIGQIRAYAGKYGISTNPESFAIHGFRKYFTDRVQNTVLRLSNDGLEEISRYGMIDYFRDNLALVTDSGKIIGGWDQHNKQYTISLQPESSEYETLVFDDNINGWVSRYSFDPDQCFSVRNNFYTYKDKKIWLHYSNNKRANFYGIKNISSITTILNQNPSVTKSFKTIDYEGDSGWELQSANTNTDTSLSVEQAVAFYSSLSDMEAGLFVNNFKLKEDTYAANLFNVTPPNNAEILSGQDLSGIKGYYLNCVMNINVNNQREERKLFMVGSSVTTTNGY